MHSVTGVAHALATGRAWLRDQMRALRREGQWWVPPIILAVCVILALLPGTGVDYLNVFYHASEHEFSRFYYPQWALLVLKASDLLPPGLAYFAFLLFQSACVAVGCRYFGGDLRAVFLNYTALRFMLLGQFDGVVILGLAILERSLMLGHPWVAGIGLVAALTKPQVGLPLALLFLWRRLDGNQSRSSY